MKNKTALQVLIEELDQQAKICPIADRKIYLYCKSLAMRKLPEEKEQIVSTFNMGMETFSNDTTIEVYQGEQFYQETYE